MVDNKKLELRIKGLYSKDGLNEGEQQQLVREVNYLANMVIDSYLARKKEKNYGEQPTIKSE